MAVSRRIPRGGYCGRSAHRDPWRGTFRAAVPVHRSRDPHPPRLHAHVPARHHPPQGRHARPAPCRRKPRIPRTCLLPRGPAIPVLRDARDETAKHDSMARPRQCPAPRFGRGGRLCATVAAARPGPGRAPPARGWRADGNRPDGDPARTRRVLHPAARRVDFPTDGRLPTSLRARDLLRDGLVRGTHLPRDPVEAGGGRPRHARRPPLRDRDLRIPSHLLPERGRPRVRVRGGTVLRTHRPQDAEPLGRHPEPQPRERHLVSRCTVPHALGHPDPSPAKTSMSDPDVHEIRYVRLCGRTSRPTQYEMSSRYQMYNRVGTPSRVHSQNCGAIETAVASDRIAKRFLPLRKSRASSGATRFLSSMLMTCAKAARISMIPVRSNAKRVDAYAPMADTSAEFNEGFASSTLFNR